MKLYRLYDDADRLLYVGISISAINRFAQHKADKPWIDDVAHMAVEDLGDVDRRTAEECERAVILEERPLHNKVHNGGRASSPGKQKPPRPTSAGRKPRVSIARHSIVGLYVLFGDYGGKGARQGRITRGTPDGYLVEWFSWWTGNPNGSSVVTVERLTMPDVRLYERHDQFLAAADASMRRQEWGAA